VSDVAGFFSASLLRMATRRLTFEELADVYTACNAGPGGLRILPSRNKFVSRLKNSPHAFAILTSLENHAEGEVGFARDAGLLLGNHLKTLQLPCKRPRALAGKAEFTRTDVIHARSIADTSQVPSYLEQSKSEKSGYLNLSGEMETAELIKDLPSGIFQNSLPPLPREILNSATNCL
jgi:hypothetical protein